MTNRTDYRKSCKLRIYTFMKFKGEECDFSILYCQYSILYIPNMDWSYSTSLKLLWVYYLEKFFLRPSPYLTYDGIKNITFERSTFQKLRIKQIIKGSSDSSHFIFEINVGKRRIRHRTTLNLTDAIFNRFWVDLKVNLSILQLQSCFMSDPTLSDNDFKNKMGLVWTILNSRPMNAW